MIISSNTWKNAVTIKGKKNIKNNLLFEKWNEGDAIMFISKKKHNREINDRIRKNKTMKYFRWYWKLFLRVFCKRSILLKEIENKSIFKEKK